jgi:hypothetical protein
METLQNIPSPDPIVTYVTQIDTRITTEETLEKCLPALISDMTESLRRAVRGVRR